MTTYFAREALLPEGWKRNVHIAVDTEGTITAIGHGAPGGSAQTLAGPLLPGMANLHSHAFQRAMAGLTETRSDPHDDFWSWRELMYRFVDRLTPEHAFTIARHLYIEMLKRGYTAVAEFHYVHNRAGGAPYAAPAELALRHLEAARAAGIAITLLPSLYMHGNFGRKPLQPHQERFRTDASTILRIAEAVQHAGRGDGNLVVGVAPHSLRAVDPQSLADLVAGARALGEHAPVHIHAAEQIREVEESVAWCGRRPVHWLLEHAGADGRWCIVHATHVTPEETRALAASGAVVGLCPSTEANLGDGIFPLVEYRAAGGRFGIGGDSHVSRDPVEELRLLEYVQRLVHRQRNLNVSDISPSVGTTLWLEAAAGGAQAIGRPTGRIAPGARADFVVLDENHPELTARSGDAITNALVFSGGTDMVRDVAVAGRWVINDRRHDSTDEAVRDYDRVLGELRA
ncbi:MAG: formimidoylglutamate deiminase [Betaproteobacteria bacterium]|nr:formimidoylglutamate deiminase [Betaproteobacteria bacterium]